MDIRRQQLSDLKAYIDNIDKETTLLLQNLQWDQKHLVESKIMVTCAEDTNHRIPLTVAETHEKQCYRTRHGYSVEDTLLPDPVDPNANTVVKLSKQDILDIIHMASSSDPAFIRGSPGPEPLSAERLQQAYSADERRALHDAVVGAAPFCHDLTDLALTSSKDSAQGSREKSRAEILAELRDMRRRRAKYRGAAHARNYSHALRDVIKTQMELYAEVKGIVVKTECGPNTNVTNNVSTYNNSEDLPSNVVIKQERRSTDFDNNSEYASGNSRRHRDTSRSRDSSYHDCRRKHEKEIHSSKNRHDVSKDNYSSIEKRRRDDGRDRHTNTKERYYDDDNYYRNDKKHSVEFKDRGRKTSFPKDRQGHGSKHDIDNYDNSEKDMSVSSAREKRVEYRRNYKEDSSRKSIHDKAKYYKDVFKNCRDETRHRNKNYNDRKHYNTYEKPSSSRDTSRHKYEKKKREDYPDKVYVKEEKVEYDDGY